MSAPLPSDMPPPPPPLSVVVASNPGDIEMDPELPSEQPADASTIGNGKGKGKGKAKEGGDGEATVAKKPRQPAPKKPAQRGTTTLPYSRIQRIMKADKDIEICTREAGFLVSVATELFVQHFAEQAYTVAQLNRRKAITYKDLGQCSCPGADSLDIDNLLPPSADAVAQQWPLSFLKETVPHAIPLSKALAEQRAKQEATYAIEAGLIEGDGEVDADADVPRQDWVPAIDPDGKVISQRHSRKSGGGGTGAADGDEDHDDDASVPKRGTARTLSMASNRRQSSAYSPYDKDNSAAAPNSSHAPRAEQYEDIPMS